MVKKILSILGIIGIMSTMSVSTAVAASDDSLILGVTPAGLTEQNNKTVSVDGPHLPIASFTLAEGSNVVAKIYDGLNEIRDLGNICIAAPCSGVTNVYWDGKKNDSITLAGGSNYTLKITATALSDGDTDTAELSGVIVPLYVSASSISTVNLDPSKNSLTVSYTDNRSDESATLKILKVTETGTTEVKAESASLTWGSFSTETFPLPGDHVAKLKITAPNSATYTRDFPFTVAYTDPSAPKLGVIAASKTSFNSDTESTVFSFSLTGNADVLAEIYDSTNLTSPVYTSSDFDGETETQASNSLSLEWTGKNSVCGFAKSGTYLLKLTARNSFGVDSVSSALVTVTSTASATCVLSPSKITSIVLDPSAASLSSTWDPLEDKLEISWETTVDFDNFTVEARKGNDEPIEIYEEGDIEADDYDAEFEGKDDDDEYIEAGTWELVFIGENKDGTFYVKKTFYVGYEKPEIDDTFVTKKSIDPDVGEGTYFGFKLNNDAKVDVEVLKGTVSKVDLLEDEEVKQDVWYAVYWDGKDDDGDDFDYDDTFKIRLTARSLGDDKVTVTATESVDLDEDDVSSAKSNVTLDGLVPPVVEQGGDVVLTFNVEDDADLRVGIWKGTSTSGSPEAELQAYKSSKAGDYEFSWDTKDEDGKNVKEGFYTYKVFTKKGSTSSVESESGQFVVGDVGDLFGGAEEASADEEEPVVEPKTPVTACGFADVLSGNKNCAAIKWAKDNGIFEGDLVGFRPYDSINRAEVLAVIMRAFEFPLYGDDGTNLGWKDTLVGSWYMSYLRSGKLYGLLSGYTDNTVRPANSVTRVELLKFVYEAAKKAGVSAVTTCTMNPYADVFADSWALNYVCQAKTDKLFDVLGDMFLPNEAASRAEVAEALYRLLK